MTLHGVTGDSPVSVLSGIHPTGRPGTDGTVQRGQGRKAGSRRRTERTACHEGKRGCPHKRKRRMSSAAGWPNNNYWTGVANDTDNARNVNVNDGNDNWNNVGNNNHTVCRR